MDRLLNAAILALVPCALAVAGVALYREVSGGNGSGLPPVRTVPNWREFAADGQRLGSPEAEVSIVVFSDFQCPACRGFAALVPRVREVFGDAISVVYRHYPLERAHPFARTAAIAAECAADQRAFAEYHDALFAGQDAIGRVPWTAYAISAGVPDTALFSRCVRAEETAARVARDIVAGDALGVSGTPTVLVNDRVITAALREDQLVDLVRAARFRARRTSVAPQRSGGPFSAPSDPLYVRLAKVHALPERRRRPAAG